MLCLACMYNMFTASVDSMLCTVAELVDSIPIILIGENH